MKGDIIMKFKTTRKAIVTGSCNIVCAGYCDLQFLLWGHSPVAYTCGVYGWNFDVYEINGLTICTGYRGMPGRRAKNIAEYEKRARAIVEDYRIPYNERLEKVEKVLAEFVAQA